jgi:hypothetical protein
MSKVEYFFMLCEHAFGFLIFFWPITILLIVALVMAGVFASPFRSESFQRNGLMILLPFLLSVFILLMGTIFRHDTSTGIKAPAWPSIVVVILLLGHIPAGIYLTHQFRGGRWFTFVISLLQMWFSLSAAFVSEMSVSAEWI